MYAMGREDNAPSVGRMGLSTIGKNLYPPALRPKKATALDVVVWPAKARDAPIGHLLTWSNFLNYALTLKRPS